MLIIPFLVLFISPTLTYSNHVTSTTTPQLHAPTLTPAAAFARRDGIPTLTFGPASNYVNEPSNAPTLANGGFSIVKRSEATGGLDIFLGPDKQKKVQNIIDTSCPDNPSSQCIQDMAQAFDYKEVGIQARQVGIFVISAIVLAFAYWLQHKLDDNAQKADHAFLPETDMSQAASVLSSSTIVFVTTPQDPHPVTIMSTDTADPVTSGLVVSTATASGDGYGQGDVVIQLPADLGNRLHYFIGMASQCAKPQVDQTGLDCVEQVSEDVMLQSSQNAPFRDLVLVTTTLPGLKDDLGTHLANVVQYATQKLTGLALSDEGVKFLAEVAFWVVYEQLVKQIQAPDQVVIPAASTVSAAPAASSTTSCPPEDRKPNCSNCGGTQTNENKTSGFCPGPKWKGCPCVDGPTYPFDLMDAATFAKAQAALRSIPTIERDPTGNMVKCAGAEKSDVLSNNVQNNIDDFCGKHDGQEVGNGTIEDWYDNGNGNWISFWISQDQVTCGNPHQRINKIICSHAMNVAVKTCATGETTKGATTGGYQCMNFGFYGTDAATAGKPVQCPDSNPLLNLAQNPCDTKCNNAGWDNCSPDTIGGTRQADGTILRAPTFIKFSCHCKNTAALTSPCVGMMCGDPIKMRDGPLNEAGQPRYGQYRAPNGRVILKGLVPHSVLACDVICANGNYDCADRAVRLFMGTHFCKCTDEPSKGQGCADIIRDYGVGGR